MLELRRFWIVDKFDDVDLTPEEMIRHFDELKRMKPTRFQRFVMKIQHWLTRGEQNV